MFNRYSSYTFSADRRGSFVLSDTGEIFSFSPDFATTKMTPSFVQDLNISAGGAGEVRAFRNLQGTPVFAVKSFFTNDPDFAKTEKECAVWNKVYPDLPAYIAVDSYKSRNFRLIMPFLGTPLALYKPKTEAEKFKVQLAVLEALQELHKKGIAHNDIHAGNILIAIKPSENSLNDIIKIHFIDFEISVTRNEDLRLFTGALNYDLEKVEEILCYLDAASPGYARASLSVPPPLQAPLPSNVGQPLQAVPPLQAPLPLGVAQPLSVVPPLQAPPPLHAPLPSNMIAPPPKSSINVAAEEKEIDRCKKKLDQFILSVHEKRRLAEGLGQTSSTASMSARLATSAGTIQPVSTVLAAPFSSEGKAEYPTRPRSNTLPDIEPSLVAPPLTDVGGGLDSSSDATPLNPPDETKENVVNNKR